MSDWIKELEEKAIQANMTKEQNLQKEQEYKEQLYEIWKKIVNFNETLPKSIKLEFKYISSMFSQFKDDKTSSVETLDKSNQKILSLFRDMISLNTLAAQIDSIGSINNEIYLVHYTKRIKFHDGLIELIMRTILESKGIEAYIEFEEEWDHARGWISCNNNYNNNYNKIQKFIKRFL